MPTLTSRTPRQTSRTCRQHARIWLWALRTSLGLDPKKLFSELSFASTSCVPSLWAARVETPTYRDLCSIGSGRLCVVCRFVEPAEDAANWCLNKPCLITLSRNPAIQTFQKSSTWRTGPGLVLLNRLLLHNLQLASSFSLFFSLRANHRGRPPRSGLCGERWSPPPAPSYLSHRT